MKNRVQLLKITYHGARSVFILSLVSVYLLLLLAGLSGYKTGPETARMEILIAAQLWIPLGGGFCGVCHTYICGWITMDKKHLGLFIEGKELV